MNELLSLLPSGGIARFAWDLAWQSTLLGLVALLAMRFLVKRPAQRAWFAMLATSLCVAVPLVSLAVRASGLGLLREPKAVALLDAAAAIPAPSSVSAVTTQRTNNDELTSVEVGTETDFSIAVAAPQAGDRNIARLSRASSFEIPSLLTVVIIGATTVWAVLAFAALARLLNGIASVRRLCRDAVDCDDTLIVNSCLRAARAMGLQREPKVAVSACTSCPTVLAWGRPRLFIPPLADSKSEQQWFSVFSHELAHVQRGDGWSQLMMEVALILIPWQPLMRILRREHHQACEEACDDWALFAGADPIELAATLTEWIPSEASLALGIGSGTISVRLRIERLLQVSSPPQPQLGRRLLFGSVATAVGASCFLALLQVGTLPTQARTHPAAPAASPTVAADRWGHNRSALSVDVDRSGRIVTVLGSGRMQHWNSAEVLGFGPEHKTVFSRGRDDLVKVWDVDTGNQLRELALPASVDGYRWWEWDQEIRQQYSIDVLLSSDGKTLFLGKADGTVDLLDAGTFELQRVLKVPGELPKKLAISADGKRLAALRQTMTDGMCAAIVLDVATGATVASIQQAIPIELRQTVSAPWRDVELSPDGNQLAVSRNGDATLWNVETGQLLREFDGGWNLRFSPDGGTLVAHTRDQQLKLWDVATGQLKSRIRSFATSSQVAFAPDGSRLAIVDGSHVQLCRVDNGERVWMSNMYNPSRHFSEPSVTFHKAGHLLAISSGHGVALFDALSGKEVGCDRTAVVTSIAVDPVGGELATGDSNGQVDVWDIASGTPRQTWTAHDLGVGSLTFSPDGRSLASSAFEHVVIWDSVSGTLRETVQPKQAQRGSNPVSFPMAFTSDSAKLLLCHRSRELKVWQVGSGSYEEYLQFDAAPLVSYAFAITSDNLLIAHATGEARGLGVWSLKTGQQLQTLPCGSGRLPLATSTDGRRIATGARGDRISVWDLERNKHIELVKGHSPRYLQALAFSPNGRVLASAARDGKVQLWNSESGERIETLQIGPRSGIIDQLAFSANGRHLVSRNGNGTAFVLRVESELLALD